MGDEAVPLPRHRVEAEQVAQQHAVGAGVGDDGDAQVGPIEVPHRQRLLGAVHATRRPVTLGAGADTLDEVARWLATTTEAVPAILGGRVRGPPRRRCEPARPACRASSARGSPRGTARPSRRRPCGGEQRRRGLAGTPQRRDDDLVEVLAAEFVADALGLHVATFGEGRIDDVEAIANPFGFAVADEDDVP